MKLFASLLTTVGITGLVWGILHIQPAIADASTEQPIKEVSTVKPSRTKPIKAKPLVTTNTQPIASQATQTIYQEISSDFSEATITIGFPTQQSRLNKNKPLIKIPSKAKGTLLLGKGEHTEQELAHAWEGIAILKEVDMVIEHHQLNQHGLPDSSELYVYYKNNQ